MPLPVNKDSFDYKFNKTLNEDVKLVSNEYGEYDLDMSNGDYVNVTGLNSLLNACIIKIMTRYNELSTNPTYQGFGCHAHELIKDNQTKMVTYKLEESIFEALDSMRRVQTVNSVTVTKSVNAYSVDFNITSINDETITGSVNL